MPKICLLSNLSMILLVPCSWCASSPYMIFVSRANIFIWSNFATHENLRMLCGGKLLSLKSNFTPPHEYFCLSCGEKLPHMSRNFALHLYHHDLCCWRCWRCFDEKLILSRFTRFCVKPKLTQKSSPLSKIGKYHVCLVCWLWVLGRSWQICYRVGNVKASLLK